MGLSCGSGHGLYVFRKVCCDPSNNLQEERKLMIVVKHLAGAGFFIGYVGLAPPERVSWDESMIGGC